MVFVICGLEFYLTMLLCVSLTVTSLTISVKSIYKLYLSNSNSQMPTYLKTPYTLSFAMYTTSNIGWTIYLYFVITGDCQGQGSKLGEFIGAYGMSFGYYFLIVSFAIRTYHAFHDSILQLSHLIVRYCCIMAAIIFIGILLRFMAVFGGLEKYHAYSVYLSAILMSLYISHSILLLKVMFYKLSKFNQMVKYRFNMTSTNNANTGRRQETEKSRKIENSIEMVGCELNRVSSETETETERETSQSKSKLEAKSDMNAECMVLIKRLTVLYSIALIGAFFLLFSSIIHGTILAKYGDFQHNIYIWYFAVYIRIAAQIDGITNCICLLLHNAKTNHVYEKYCACCQTCIFDTSFCRLLCPCLVTLNERDCCHCCVKWT